MEEEEGVKAPEPTKKPEAVKAPEREVVEKKDEPKKQLVQLIDSLNIGRDNVTPTTSKTILIHVVDDKLRHTMVHALNKNLRIVMTHGKDPIRTIAMPKYAITNTIVITDSVDDLTYGYNTVVLDAKTTKTYRYTHNRQADRHSKLTLDNQRKTVRIVIKGLEDHEKRKYFVDFIAASSLFRTGTRMIDMETNIASSETGTFTDIQACARSPQFSRLTPDMIGTTVMMNFPIENFTSVNTLMAIFSNLHYSLRPIVDISTINTIISRERDMKKSFIASPAELPANDPIVKRIMQIDEQYGLTLKYHQQYAIHNMFRSKCLVLQCDTGIGKSRMAIGGVLTMGIKHALYVTEAGVTLEVDREMKKIGFTDYKILKDAKDRHLAKFNIISYSQLSTGKLTDVLKNTEFGAIIYDECFPYNTLIDTDQGQKRIGDIVTRRLKVKVMSKNLSTGDWAYKPVVHYFAKPYLDKLIHLQYNIGSIICTPNHKVWVKDKGYVKAENIKAGDTVCVLPETDNTRSNMQLETKQVLQSRVLHQDEVSRETTNNKDVSMVQERVLVQEPRSSGRQEETILRGALLLQVDKRSAEYEGKVQGEAEDNDTISYCREQSTRIQLPVRENAENEQGSRLQEESDSRNERKMEEESYISWQGRKWSTNGAPIIIAPSSEFANRVHNLNEGNETQVSRDVLPQELQSRLSNSRQEDSYRSGRRIAQDQEMEIPGRTKDQSVEYVRVESVKILEQGSPELNGTGYTDDHLVYNIDVEDNHNYIANNLLVSNCQGLRNPDTERFGSAMRLKAKRYYFMSATSLANDAADLLSYLLIGRRVVTVEHDFMTKVTSNRASRNRFTPRVTLDSEAITTYSDQPCTKMSSFEEVRRQLSGEYPTIMKIYREQYMTVIQKTDRSLVKDESFRIKAKTLKMSIQPSSEHMDLYLEKLDAVNRAHHPEQASMISLQMITELMKVSEVPHLFVPKMKPTKKQMAIVNATADCMKRKNSVIIFTGFTESAKKITELLKEAELNTILVTSDMDTKQRYKKIEEFRKAEKSALIGNIDLIGKGFNLEVADTVIMSDIPWSPFKYDQSIGRILRPDQKGAPEVINCLNKTMIDNYKFEVLLAKQNRIEKMIDKNSDLEAKDLVHINFTEFLSGVIKEAKEGGLI
jgi:hypothetical protein